MFRKLLIFPLVALMALSCQRGEDDPQFSFLSRKKRLVGSWNVIDYKFSSDDSTAAMSGDSLISMSNDSTIRTGIKFDLTFEFDKDGKFIKTEVVQISSDSLEDKITTTISGSWEFTGGNNSPSKSKLALFEEQWEQRQGTQGSNVKIFTTTGSAAPKVYDIKELRDSKVVLTQNTTVADPFTSHTQSLSITLESVKD